VRGENDLGIWLLRRRGVDIKAVALHRDFSRLVTYSAKLPVKIISNRSFVAGDGFDVDELASQRDGFHARRINYRLRGSGESAASGNLNFVIGQNSTIRSLFLESPAGRLEALLNAGAENATHAAVVCHPHPLFGGTLHNKVVFHTMKALNGFGFPVLRFNFRGTGLSHGEHDGGKGEVEDVRTALGWLDAEFHLPLVFAGFSFGAAVGLRAASSDARVKALIGVGVPAVPVAAGAEEPRAYSFDFLRACAKPKLFVSGARDQFAPRARLEELVASVPEPKKLVVIEGADHFFEGRLREMREAIERWVRETIVEGLSI
jgi:uncharacterized protein